MKLKVVLEDGGKGWTTVYVPALKGCVSQGRTREEAIANIREAIEGWLLVEEEKLGTKARKKAIEVVAVAV